MKKKPNKTWSSNRPEAFQLPFTSPPFTPVRSLWRSAEIEKDTEKILTKSNEW
jgi:hypothetical protein